MKRHRIAVRRMVTMKTGNRAQTYARFLRHEFLSGYSSSEIDQPEHSVSSLSVPEAFARDISPISELIAMTS